MQGLSAAVSLSSISCGAERSCARAASADNSSADMNDSEANRDEALRCVAIARRALQDGDLAKAEKFVAKGQRLYNCTEVAIMAARIEELKAAKDQAPNHSAHQTPHTNGGHHHTDHARSANARTGGASSSAAAGSGHRQGEPAGMGGSHRQPADAGVKRRQSHAPEKPVIDENAGTPEQRKLVADILRSKDLYEILSLPRNCSDDDIKKAYRKLALKLHPDKNKAAHAEEAFKAVSKAFSCLSDSDKRAYYDRTGYESNAAATAAAAQQQQQRRAQGMPGGMHYAEDFDADEIFNMFFGGGLHGQMFRAQFGGPRRRAHAAAQQQQQHQQQQHARRADPSDRQHSMMLGALVQFLPVILLLLFSMFSMFNTSSYSLARDHQYRDQMHTTRLDIPFYVKSRHDFERSYPERTSSRLKIESEIESEYYSRISQRCQQERLTRQRLMYSWSTRDEARKMRMPSCEEIDRINEKLGAPPVRAY